MKQYVLLGVFVPLHPEVGLVRRVDSVGPLPDRERRPFKTLHLWEHVRHVSRQMHASPEVQRALPPWLGERAENSSRDRRCVGFP